MERGDDDAADPRDERAVQGVRRSGRPVRYRRPGGARPEPRPRSSSIAKDEAMPPAAANDAIALIRAIGTPQCSPPLVSMVAHPHPDPRFKYVGRRQRAHVRRASRRSRTSCRRCPDAAPTHRTSSSARSSGEIAKMTAARPGPRGRSATCSSDKRTVARWVAVEALAAMKSAEENAPDRPRCRGQREADRLLGGPDADQGRSRPDPGSAREGAGRRLVSQVPNWRFLASVEAM